MAGRAHLVAVNGGLGDESMTEVQRLLREAGGEEAAVAGLRECVDRLERARAAKTALAALPADELRAALRLRRADLETGTV
jgi:thioredoxin-like negative regulator of GroEL